MTWGLDLDNVLADTASCMVHFHNRLHGTAYRRTDIKRYNIWEVWGGTREEAVREMIAFQESPFFKIIPPVLGSQEALTHLASHRKLAVVTARPRTLEQETLRWLTQHFPQVTFSDVYLTNEWTLAGNGRKKSDVCKELGIDTLVEDSPDCSAECAAEGIRVLLYDCPWNQSETLHDRVTRVSDWEAILRYARNGLV